MITFEVEHGIAAIGLRSAETLSRHSIAAAIELTEAIHACDDRDDVKAIILHNDDGDFCPRIDDVTIPADDIWTLWQHHFAGPAGLYQSLCFSRKVTITAVDGVCSSAGTLLTLCADISIASNGARFGSPFRQLPESSLVLAALIMGLNRAKAWAFTDTELSAKAAFDCGLINVISDGPARPAAQQAARSIARLPLDGIAMSKLLVEGCLDTQGVAQEFDAAALTAASRPRISIAEGVRK